MTKIPKAKLAKGMHARKVLVLEMFIAITRMQSWKPNKIPAIPPIKNRANYLDFGSSFAENAIEGRVQITKPTIALTTSKPVVSFSL